MRAQACLPGMKASKPTKKKVKQKETGPPPPDDHPRHVRILCEYEQLPRWAKSMEELAGVLRKHAPVLRGYHDRNGAPLDWIPDHGYDVWAMRWWMHSNGYTPGVNAANGRPTDNRPPATPALGGSTTPGGAATIRLKEAQAKKQEANARAAELDLKERLGELVPLEEVKQRDVARIMLVKRGLMAFPREVCSLLYGLSVPEMEVIMQQKVRDLLERFSRTVSQPEVKNDGDGDEPEQTSTTG